MDKDKVLETARKALQGRVDEAAAAYRAALEGLHRDVAASLDKFDRYRAPVGTMRGFPEGYVDNLNLNVGTRATAVAATASAFEEARRTRDEVLADLKARLEVA
jgi:hypothetical protein